MGNTFTWFSQSAGKEMNGKTEYNAQETTKLFDENACFFQDAAQGSGASSR